MLRLAVKWICQNVLPYGIFRVTIKDPKSANCSVSTAGFQSEADSHLTRRKVTKSIEVTWNATQHTLQMSDSIVSPQESNHNGPSSLEAHLNTFYGLQCWVLASVCFSGGPAKPPKQKKLTQTLLDNEKQWITVLMEATTTKKASKPLVVLTILSRLCECNNMCVRLYMCVCVSDRWTFSGWVGRTKTQKTAI